MEYYIALSNFPKKSVKWEKVDGRPIKGTPFDLFFHHDKTDGIRISEATTGHLIMGGWFVAPNRTDEKVSKHIILAAITKVMVDPMLVAKMIGNYQAQGWISPLYKEIRI